MPIRPNKKWAIAVAGALTFLTFFAWFIPPVWILRNGSIQVVQWPKTGEQISEVGPGTPGWVSYERVSHHLIHAIVVSEDDRFFVHDGIDISQILKSLKTNIEKGYYARGGSTITQQVVKIAFLDRSKNLVRKAREAIGALILESFFTKSEIIEWYINLVEFGDGVYGARQAAAHYFDTKPELLTIQQATHLALVLPSPNNWSKGLRQRRLTDFGHERFAQIINRMHSRGYITDDLWHSALAMGDFGRPIKAYEAHRNEDNHTNGKVDP